MKTVRVVFMSDTHDRWPAPGEIPEGDILVHAGDHTMMGEDSPLIEAGYRLRQLPHKYKVFIAGNHDWMFQTNREYAKQAMGVGERGMIYLENEGIELMGLKFWGSPQQPEFNNWAFNVKRGPDIRKYWDMIPEGLDVLITHGPPRGVLDKSGFPPFESCGCDDLAVAVREKYPKVHVFGHIHGGYGMDITTPGKDEYHQTVFYNASLVNEQYKLTNKPFWTDFCLDEKGPVE